MFLNIHLIVFLPNAHWTVYHDTVYVIVIWSMYLEGMTQLAFSSMSSGVTGVYENLEVLILIKAVEGLGTM